MKFLFFCQNSYAFGIVDPIRAVVLEKGYEVMWFLKAELNASFPYQGDPYTNSLKTLKKYPSDVIIVPGNEVPHYLRGVKVQIFHGLAGEKRTHFRIRHYFDLYLTQGPYFTDKFNELQQQHRNFEVMETGWSKLDKMYIEQQAYSEEKETLLNRHNAKKIILFAPTFTPYLTCAEFVKEEIVSLAGNQDYLILCKFHALMDHELIETYRNIAAAHDNVVYEEEKNITKFLILADLMISDTSSVVYEFLLLNKPVITFKNIAENKYWEDIDDPSILANSVEKTFTEDSYKNEREFIIKNYHPYTDGRSSERMVNAIEQFIQKNGVPKKRRLSPYRKYRIHKRFRDHL
ncbi:MAG: CDP-glycerol glycerophosphotransferase family protein [Bacteroidota bacterium]